MSEQNHEQRIAALEKLVCGMAQFSKASAGNDAALTQTIIETKELNMLTLRLILEAGLIKNDAIRQPLVDMIARHETKHDQIMATVRDIQANLNQVPPSAPPGAN